MRKQGKSIRLSSGSQYFMRTDVGLRENGENQQDSSRNGLKEKVLISLETHKIGFEEKY